MPSSTTLSTSGNPTLRQSRKADGRAALRRGPPHGRLADGEGEQPVLEPRERPAIDRHFVCRIRESCSVLLGTPWHIRGFCPAVGMGCHQERLGAARDGLASGRANKTSVRTAPCGPNVATEPSPARSRPQREAPGWARTGTACGTARRSRRAGQRQRGNMTRLPRSSLSAGQAGRARRSPVPAPAPGIAGRLTPATGREAHREEALPPTPPRLRRPASRLPTRSVPA